MESENSGDSFSSASSDSDDDESLTLQAPKNKSLSKLGDTVNYKYSTKVKDRISQLEKDVASLKAPNDASAILFCSLGFENRNDVASWLLKHSPGRNFGWVIDDHTLCEHLFAQMFSRDSTILGNLQNLAKLKLTIDTEGISVSSFERKTPKIFSKTLAFKVIRSDASYFDTISSHADWNTADDGFRDTLLHELKSFQHDHNQLLRESLGDGTTI